MKDYSELWDVVDQMTERRDMGIGMSESMNQIFKNEINWYINRLEDALTRLGIERKPKRVCGECRRWRKVEASGSYGMCKAGIPACAGTTPTWPKQVVFGNPQATACPCFELKE